MYTSRSPIGLMDHRIDDSRTSSSVRKQRWIGREHPVRLSHIQLHTDPDKDCISSQPLLGCRVVKQFYLRGDVRNPISDEDAFKVQNWPSFRYSDLILIVDLASEDRQVTPLFGRI